jgi:hypothetical protein
MTSLTPNATEEDCWRALDDESKRKVAIEMLIEAATKIVAETIGEYPIVRDRGEGRIQPVKSYVSREYIFALQNALRRLGHDAPMRPSGQAPKR